MHPQRCRSIQERLLDERVTEYYKACTTTAKELADKSLTKVLSESGLGSLVEGISAKFPALGGALKLLT